MLPSKHIKPNSVCMATSKKYSLKNNNNKQLFTTPTNANIHKRSLEKIIKPKKYEIRLNK